MFSTFLSHHLICKCKVYILLRERQMVISTRITNVHQMHFCSWVPKPYYMQLYTIKIVVHRPLDLIFFVLHLYPQATFTTDPFHLVWVFYDSCRVHIQNLVGVCCQKACFNIACPCSRLHFFLSKASTTIEPCSLEGE